MLLCQVKALTRFLFFDWFVHHWLPASCLVYCYFFKISTIQIFKDCPNVLIYFKPFQQCRFTTVHKHLQQFTNIYYSSQTFTTVHKHLLQFTNIYYSSQIFTTVHKHLLQFTNIYYSSQTFTTVHKHFTVHKHLR